VDSLPISGIMFGHSILAEFIQKLMPKVRHIGAQSFSHILKNQAVLSFAKFSPIYQIY
jgi:hypothetical protein